MSYLIDTSVLVRLANLSDPLRPCAVNAITHLHRTQETLYLAAQNLIEFRSVATRPTVVNGLGLSAAEATEKSREFAVLFGILADIPAIFPEWKRLVEMLDVVGKQVHDARLIAICSVHSIDHVLTFNTTHFLRLSQALGALAVVDPRQF